ncbi:MAG: MaoC/PaaZ C-terminal domain-containing protein [Halieaceae bacterium]|jgi:acyl dehydratase|nr:MaoC/PaaZ C-terminal domain-containing protein [Halieaceae bacterium]
MPQLVNYTYDEITIGQTARYARLIGERDIQLFAAVSGDVNPVHLDPDFAAGTTFGGCIAHGMLTGAIISAALAMELPGPGTIYLSQSLTFRLPVKPGDTVTVALEVTDKQERRRIVTLDCKASNQAGKVVATGSAQVIAPAQKLAIARPPLPRVEVLGEV